MRTKSHFILLLLLLGFYGCDTESNLDPRFEDYFIKYYGGSGNQVAVDFQILNDGFLLAGNSVSSTVSKSQIFVVKTDVLGNELWSREYGGDKNEFANALEVDQNGNAYLAITIEVDTDDKDVKILKLNVMDGQPLDSIIVGEPNFEEVASNILLTSNGDVILSGYTTNVDVAKPGYQPETDLEDIFTIRTTSDLEIFDEAQWRRISGFPGVDRGVEILERPDGTFLFFGTSNRTPIANMDQDGFNMFLFPANNNGIAISTSELQLFGSTSNEEAVQIIPTFGGGYTMIGTTSNGPASSDAFIVRLRSNNDIIETATIDLQRIYTSSSIIEDVNGGLLILGNDFEGANSDILLLKRSLGGDILWERSFGGIDPDLSGEVQQLDDGSILVFGTIRLESQTKLALIKTNSSGEFLP